MIQDIKIILAGFLVDYIPPKWLPARLVAWYHNALKNYDGR